MLDKAGRKVEGKANRRISNDEFQRKQLCHLSSDT
jgi:hypothetical protein